MTLANVRSLLSELPVNAMLDDIVDSALSGSVTIVNSDTGSGKTLLVPSQLAERLVEEGIDDEVIVLEPRRFLVGNAAETVTDIAKLTLGDEVGYAVGVRGREDVFYTPGRHRLTFITYGYALVTELILKAKIFVIDESHEQSLDMAICKALIKKRMDEGEKLTVIIMSATMDTAIECEYWNKYDPKVFTSKGRLYPCQFILESERPIQYSILDLINIYERTGILVFVPGVADIEEVQDELETLLSAQQIDHVEIASIHGQSTFHERKMASAYPAEGKIKVLIGTNVIESGVNLPWVNGGVTTGTGKEVHVNPNTEAVFLKLDELPQWRIRQQQGRVPRFGPGVFILNSKVPFEDRPIGTTPEIERLPLTELVMHCARFKLKADELEFLPQPPRERIIEAEKRLKRFGFVDNNLRLTEVGEWTEGIPAGVMTKAILAEAHALDILNIMLPLAAVIEVGGVRKDLKFSHGCDRTSDILDGAIAFARAMRLMTEQPHVNHRNEFGRLNVGFKKYNDTIDVIRAFQGHFHTNAEYGPYLEDNFCDGDADLIAMIKSCIFAGYISGVYSGVTSYRGDVVANISEGTSYKMSNSSAFVLSEPSCVVTATLRVVTPKKPGSFPFTVAENLTAYTEDELQFISRRRPHQLVLNTAPELGLSLDPKAKFWFVFDKPVFKLREIPTPIPKQHDAPGMSLGTILERAIVAQRVPPVRAEREEDSPAPSELGHELSKALRRTPIKEKSKPPLVTATSVADLASAWGGRISSSRKK